MATQTDRDKERDQEFSLFSLTKVKLIKIGAWILNYVYGLLKKTVKKKQHTHKTCHNIDSTKHMQTLQSAYIIQLCKQLY